MINEEKINQEFSLRDDVKTHFQNRFVIAGAGAGKTSTVSELILNDLMVNEEIGCENVVSITFTEKAAEELRARIIKELNDKIKKDLGNERLKKIKEGLPLMQISTIHSFCSRILKEHALGIELPIDLDIIESEDLIAFQTRFFEDWFKKQDKSELKSHLEEDANIFGFCLNTFLKIADLPKQGVELFYAKDLMSQSFDEKIKELSNRFLSMVSECMVEAGIDIDESNLLSEKGITKKGEEIFVFNKKYVDTYLSNQSALDILKSVYGLSSSLAIIGGGTSNVTYGDTIINKQTRIDFKEAFEEQKDEWSKDVEKILNKLEAQQHAYILSFVLKAREAYIKHLERPENRVFISQDKILQLCRDLVKNSKEVRKMCHEKYKRIYVDEYQDTDPVQTELFLEIIKDEDGNIAKDCCFFVGDPKQSIYAFRGADLEIYHSTQVVFQKENTYFQINFRSTDGVIRYVNSKFNHGGKFELNKEGVPADKNNPIDYQDMLPMRIVSPLQENYPILNGVYCVHEDGTDLLFKDPEIKKINKDEAIEIQNQYILRTIQTIKKNYKIAEKKDKNSLEEPRDIKNSDFLILTRNKKIIPQITAFLRENGIPVRMYGDLTFDQEKIYNRFWLLFNFLSFPYDSLYRYGAIEVLKDALICKEDICSSEQALNSLYAKTKEWNSLELLSFLAHHYEYVLDAFTDSSTIEVYQSRLFQLLEYCMEKPLEDKKGYVRLIYKFIHGEKIEKELVINDKQDAVCIMNVHKSKGLEGKIVLITERFTKKKRNAPELMKSIQDGESFQTQKYIKAIYGRDQFVKSYHCIFEGDDEYNEGIKKEDDENVRLEYVALTRAKDAVIFMPYIEKNACKEKSFFDKNDYPSSEMEYISLDDNQEEINDIETKDYQRDDMTFLNKTICKYVEVSPSFLENESGHFAKDPSKEDIFASNKDVWGVVTHRMFELLVWKIRDKEKIEFNEVINQTLLENIDSLLEREINIDEQMSQILLSLGKEFVHNEEIVNLIISSKKIYTELHFSFMDHIDQVKGDQLLLSLKKNYPGIEEFIFKGQADLVCVSNDDRITIIDYKTDYLREDMNAHLFHKYAPQQEMYRYALHQVMGIPLEKIQYGFYHLYLKEKIKFY